MMTSLLPDDLCSRIAPRVAAMGPFDDTGDPAGSIAIPPSIRDGVRTALLAGDTHYTSRPGTPALRAAVSALLVSLGAPAYDPATAIVITAGDREALFVTLLALKVGPGRVMAAASLVRRHSALLRLLSLDLLPPDPLADQPGVRLILRDAGARDREAVALAVAAERGPSVVDLLAFGTATTPADVTPLPPIDEARTVVIGSLDALPGVAAFGCGYVAGPVDVMARIRGAKQAFSICTAAPSQRAALIALGGAGVRA